MISLTRSKLGGAIFLIIGILALCHLVTARLFDQPEIFIDNFKWSNDDFSEITEHIFDNLDQVKTKYDNKWAKVLTHNAFPDYKIKLKEPQMCDPTVQQYSGYLDAGNKKHFFFWFFESRGNPLNDPIVLWLNGGPGCSSLTGLYFELGPCAVNEEGTDTIFNPHSWNNNASVIFLDQPINVGYSYGNGVSNSLAAATDVYAFLQIFFKEFPQYANLDFHIAGESYAGHYIPAIAAEINNNNKGTSSWILANQPKNLKHINLDSVLIGNGLVDPLVQYKYYADMACNSSYGPVLQESTCQQMRDAYPQCASMIQRCYDSSNAFACLPASMYCNREMIQPYQQTGLNVYDIRKPCEGGGLCYPILKAIEKFSNRNDIKTELGVDPSVEYKSCNMEINFKFQLAGDWMRPYHLLIPPLLDSNIRVLVYAGDADFICNWFGNDAWVKELEWSGKKDFNDAKVTSWKTSDGEQAGEVRTFGKFTFLRVYEAGHMVPYDQPRASLDFFNRWLSKGDL
ncbi:5249_t:CDS:2 [Dentiscutata heterogama]|uniref:5249_t:CDS:1 n=1 Tax=Dentiscutata heterogama TaxID=1316150 RepID=A0ACA9JY09_9GLOM|nr:5249_t:CDS:2 [Dentiscutata heterogama]